MGRQRRTVPHKARARTRRAIAAQAAEPDLALSIARLAIGMVSVGSQEVTRRLKAMPQDPEAGARSAPAAPPPRTLSAGDFGAGLAIESLETARRIASIAARGWRRLERGAANARHVPIVGTAVGPVHRRYREYEAALRRVSERGRLEERTGRLMVQRLIRDTTSRSFTDIAQFTVNEVTHSPEVAALVRTQSAGIATDTIQEVRANSQQADDLIERRVHSWLSLLRPGGASGRSAERGDSAEHNGG